MAGSHRTRLAALGAISLLALALGMARPAAAQAVPPEDAWSPLSCATGAITEFGAHPGQDFLIVVEVSGWIQPCLPSEPSDGFALMAYEDLGAGPGSGLAPYGPGPEPTRFHLQVAFRDYSDLPGMGLRAVCLAYAPNGRVACLGVDEGSPGEAVLTPISTDDPRVQVPTGGSDGVKVPWPICGTCL